MTISKNYGTALKFKHDFFPQATHAALQDGKDEIIGRRNCQNIGTAV